MARGFVYLTAVVDWFARRVLAWRLSITLEVDFVLKQSRKRWQTGYLQHRSGQSVYLGSLHQDVEGRQDCNLHGWQGRMARQRFC